MFVIPAAEVGQEQAGEPGANDAPRPRRVNRCNLRCKKKKKHFMNLEEVSPADSILYMSLPLQQRSVPLSGLQIEPEHLRIPADRAGSGAVATGGQHSLTLSRSPANPSSLSP